METEFWTPEPWWRGRTVFVMASGPSLTHEVCNKVRGHPAIVVNASVMLAPLAPVWFFTDSSFYEAHRELVAAWPGEVITMSKAAKRELGDRVKRVKGEGDPSLPFATFPPLGSEVIRQGRTSGHTSIALAIALGASRVTLLGFDMRVVDGREHCHTEYSGDRDLSLYAADYVPAFAGWRAAAERASVDIVNCTPGSAITEFRFADLDEVVACARS